MTPKEILDSNKDQLIQFLIDGVKTVAGEIFKGNLLPFRKKIKANDEKHDSEIHQLQIEVFALQQIVIKQDAEIKSLQQI